MGHVRFDPSSVDWQTFFIQQQIGGGSAYFEGYPYQRGYGIGSIFRSLYRFLLPIGKEIGREGLSLGGRLLDDLAKGQNPKEALVKESKQGLLNLMQKGEEKLQQKGSGRQRKNIKTQQKSLTNSLKRNQVEGRLVHRSNPLTAKKRSFDRLSKYVDD